VRLYEAIYARLSGGMPSTMGEQVNAAAS
jgi:hypothetical protein